MMDLIRRNPARDMFGLRKQMNRMFEDFFAPAGKGDDGDSLFSWNPAVDIVDNDTSIVIKAEIPGVDKKDLSVDVKDRVLTLRGERSADNEVKEDKYYRRERFYGHFERSFTLPADVDAEKIDATYTDGVLKIEVPKPEGHKPKQISVN
jgi:HSP20 family protein